MSIICQDYVKTYRDKLRAVENWSRLTKTLSKKCLQISSQCKYCQDLCPVKSSNNDTDNREQCLDSFYLFKKNSDFVKKFYMFYKTFKREENL